MAYASKSEWGRWPVLGEGSRESHTSPSIFVVGEKRNLGVPSAVSRITRLGLLKY